MELLRYQNGVMRCQRTRFGFKFIQFCQGALECGSFYAFIAIEPQNLHYFENRYKQGDLSDFSAFGDELLRGWGLVPPKDIVKHLQYKHRIQFGIDPHLIQQLSDSTFKSDDKADRHSHSFLEPLRILYPEKPIEALGC